MINFSEEQVVRSAMWAAYGDAAGFATELISKQDFTKRYSIDSLTGPIDWSRKVGGMFGPVVQFPVGTYSDDTQLRLSTSRAIRGDGYFDVESFAKVELPVWLNYSLGAGRGSKAAATHLSQREVSWSQNFFKSAGNDYCKGGGNGAAMRIQPHVWACQQLQASSFITDVVRNSICTHGHPRAVIGACIHAAMLHHTLIKKCLPTPDEWFSIGENAAVAGYESLVEDPELSLVWIPHWNNISEVSIEAAWAETVIEWQNCTEAAVRICSSISKPDEAYRKILQEMHGFDPQQRGSGLRTALFSTAIAWLYRNDSPEVGLLVAANTFQSDTDTIATMAGALLGAIAHELPISEIQDAQYIQEEAKRIYRIGLGERQPSFRYPDLLKWIPPKNQVDSWVVVAGKPRLHGLGPLSLIGTPYVSTKGDLLWQWCGLPFGQTVLAKRRKGSEELDQPSEPAQRDFLRNPPPQQHTVSAEVPRVIPILQGIDAHTSRCIKSNFDPKLIGESLLAVSQGEMGIENAIAFAAIIAKARLARHS